ncbi:MULTISPECIES: hypothetical protein [unclassified Thioalkalivibrio]|uniref:hypothetical protein n=1 Tax=unclassified Thioalkalivibrio TaxID=2621013 RepID=UPI000371E9F7|nr:MULTISPECIES: hypothetical protein [unclassified Thioalkalivibrio]
MVALSAWLLAPVAAAQCALEDHDPRDLQRVTVERVWAPDALELEDGRHIRLLGLAPAAPLPPVAPQLLPVGFGLDLRESLEERLRGVDQRLVLLPGRPARDAYGRLRMHAWIDDGPLPAASLIGDGLAMPRPGPEPGPLDECYYGAEAAAREASRGLWLERLEAFPVGWLEPPRERSQGRLRVQGEVIDVRVRDPHWVLVLDGPLDLLISGDDRDFFEDLEPRSLLGNTVVARGAVYPWRERGRMRIRHPFDLEVLDP